jgi:predicted RNA-binding protein associated with RNAse of E/G family
LASLAPAKLKLDDQGIALPSAGLPGILSRAPCTCRNAAREEVVSRRSPVVPTVTIRYRRPPDREHTFEQLLVAETPEVTITLLEAAEIEEPKLVSGAPILEPGSPILWFTFPGAWHDVGRLHLADGTFTGFYANVLTPVRMSGRRWETTDLFLDVWRGADGGVELLDEDELAAAAERGWLDAQTVGRARAEAERLLIAAREGSWPSALVHEWDLARALSARGALATDSRS